MMRQEPRRSQQDEEENSQYPEAKARGPGPIFRQSATQQQSSSEADSLRCHRDRGCTFRTIRAAELQNRGGGSARRQADADAHQGTSPEHPPHVRRDRKQQSANQRSKEARQHRRAATNLVGNTAKSDQHNGDANRIDSEDSRRHGMGEMPFLGINAVRQCVRRTCPKPPRCAASRRRDRGKARSLFTPLAVLSQIETRLEAKNLPERPQSFFSKLIR